MYINCLLNLPSELIVETSIVGMASPSLRQGHWVGGGGVCKVKGVRGKLSKGASGCRIS